MTQLFGTSSLQELCAPNSRCFTANGKVTSIGSGTFVAVKPDHRW